MNFNEIENDNDVLTAELANDMWFDVMIEQVQTGDVAYDEILERTYRVTMVNTGYQYQ